MRLELRQAGLTYQAGTPLAAPAVTDASLTIESGERIGIAGPVGSGKSTLLTMLAGMAPLTAGTVLHGGKPLGRRQAAAPGSIGFAFQSPESCLFEKSVFEDVAFAPRNLGLSEEAIRERVAEALEGAGLDPTDFSSRNPFSLSLGEQRRVALAGLLAMQPAVLLLDEPTAHLDPPTRHDIIEHLVRLNAQSGATLVVVGHDMDELARLAERLIIMDRGRIVADGKAHQLLADAGLLKRYSLKPPATVELCSLLSLAAGRQIQPVFSEQEALDLLLAAISGGGY